MTIERVLMTADAVGGVWTYAIELARALTPYGVPTTLVTMGPPPAADQIAEAAAVQGLTVVPTRFALEWTDEAGRDGDACAEWFARLEQQVRPSIVHINGYAHAALRWSAPTIVVAHSCVASWRDACGGEFDPAWFDGYCARVRRGLRAADWVVAPTKVMLQALERLHGPLRAASVIPNGRDPGLFSARTKEPLIVTAGRLWDRAKNIEAVSAIASELSWPVQIAGDVTIGHGRLPAAAMAELLGRASMFVLPARYEPFGLLPLEAALSGCALVLGDIPSLREVWGEAAVYVDPDDRSALRSAIESLIADAARLRLMASRAWRRAVKYTPADMGRRYMSLYRRVAGGRDADPWRLACAS
jgi:glycosyltransferase involved in cell wall biosynthesis